MKWRSNLKNKKKDCFTTFAKTKTKNTTTNENFYRERQRTFIAQSAFIILSFLMENVLTSLENFRASIVHIMANISGRENSQAEILLLVILWYIVLLVLLMGIHRKLLKKHKKIHENIVILYDTIRYQVARAQYGNEAIQANKWIDTILTSDHKNYLANATTIKQEILDIEQKLGQHIVTNDQRKVIKKQSKKKHSVNTFVQLIGWFVTGITVGIYKLFW